MKRVAITAQLLLRSPAERIKVETVANAFHVELNPQKGRTVATLVT